MPTPASRSFKAELQRIVEFLNVPDVKSKQLWDVLSALRGPDDFDLPFMAYFQPSISDPFRAREEAKEATTEVIRQAIGLSGDGLGILITADSAGLGPAARARIPNGHFKLHASLAFNALGLDWDKVNPPGPGGASHGLGRVRFMPAGTVT